MSLNIRVLSQQPPGGRCTLYVSYAEVLAACLGAQVGIAFTALREAHGLGSPSLLVNDSPVQPADGVLLMPGDICEALKGLGYGEEVLLGLAESLESPLERMLEGEG